MIVKHRSGQLEVAWLGPLQLAYERIDHAFNYRGTAWPGSRVFFSYLPGSGELFYDNRPVGTSALVTHRWNGVERINGSNRFNLVLVTVDEEYLEEYLAPVPGLEDLFRTSRPICYASRPGVDYRLPAHGLRRAPGTHPVSQSPWPRTTPRGLSAAGARLDHRRHRRRQRNVWPAAGTVYPRLHRRPRDRLHRVSDRRPHLDPRHLCRHTRLPANLVLRIRRGTRRITEVILACHPAQPRLPRSGRCARVWVDSKHRGPVGFLTHGPLCTLLSRRIRGATVGELPRAAVSQGRLSASPDHRFVSRELVRRRAACGPGSRRAPQWPGRAYAVGPAERAGV